MAGELTMKEALWLSSHFQYPCPHCEQDLDITVNDLFYQMGVKYADGRHEKGGWGTKCPHCKGKIRMNMSATPTKWKEEENGAHE